jgi:dihydroxy-acid dehydratase
MKYLRSSSMLERRIDTGGPRCCFKAVGYTDYELEDRPLIGIANSWNTSVPGHYNLKELGEFVKNGIYSHGGTAVDFGVIAGCDGLADARIGMNYSLPSRQVICDSIQIQAEMSGLDALVLLGSCDKIVPGMLMAAARLDIPAILVPGGPMLGGIEYDGRKSDQTTIDEAIGKYSIGKITKEELFDLEDVVCPGCGSCGFLGTANTMCCVSEALGMSLPGGALTPAPYADRRRIAFNSGAAICELAKNDVTARKIMTKEAVRNAIKVVHAICGSTNAVLHLTAIAHELELDIDMLQEFKTLSKTTPQIANVNPAAKWDMEAFHRAGGIPRVMESLGDLLDLEALTCTNKTLKENLAGYKYLYHENTDIIRTVKEPFHPTGGIAVLQGSLAPGSAITKPGAFDPSLYHFVGKAKVYNSEQEANQAIFNGKVKEGDVVVIRYEGPKGGPGMKEMCTAMKYIYGAGLSAKTALVTDGRFSGTNNGCFVGHISPEASEGGPIAIVEDGDEILIDVEKGLLELHVPDEIIKARLSRWKPLEKYIPRGYLRLYSRMATSAEHGGILKY